MTICSETGIWDLKTAKSHHRFDEALALKIVDMFRPYSTADVGCGNGQYCKFFKDHGWLNVHGYEGTQDIKKLGIYDDIMVVDLTKRRWVEIDYALTISLEVGEHIPKNFEQVFIDNLCEYVHKDLVLSWAIPGQGGKGHFNEQTNEYVIVEFEKRGLIYILNHSEVLRESASLGWFKNTLMIFRR